MQATSQPVSNRAQSGRRLLIFRGRRLPRIEPSLMLSDAMKALTTRRPIVLTTTSLCSGAFTARIARTQRLHVLRIAGFAMAGWERLDHDVKVGFFRAYGLDVQATTMPGAAEAAAAISDEIADVAFIDTLTAVRAHARQIPLQFIAIRDGMDFGYVGLPQVIDAKHYAMARFTRALRENAYAGYVDSGDLQIVVDKFAAEKLIDKPFSAEEQISRFAVMSGTR
jgi:hypothetical protein